MAPQFILGTATFGMDLTEFQEPESVQSLLKELQELGVHRLDSGARYPPRKPGMAETLIGAAKEVSSQFILDTKVYTDISNDGSGDLTKQAIEKSMLASLERLQRLEGVSPAMSCYLSDTPLH